MGRDEKKNNASLLSVVGSKNVKLEAQRKSAQLKTFTEHDVVYTVLLFGDIKTGKIFEVLQFQQDPDYRELRDAKFIKADPFRPDYQKPPLVKTTAFNAMTIAGEMVGMPAQFSNDTEVIILNSL